METKRPHWPQLQDDGFNLQSKMRGKLPLTLLPLSGRLLAEDHLTKMQSLSDGCSVNPKP